MASVAQEATAIRLLIADLFSGATDAEIVAELRLLNRRLWGADANGGTYATPFAPAVLELLAEIAAGGSGGDTTPPAWEDVAPAGYQLVATALFNQDIEQGSPRYAYAIALAPGATDWSQGDIDSDGLVDLILGGFDSESMCYVIAAAPAVTSVLQAYAVSGGLENGPALGTGNYTHSPSSPYNYRLELVAGDPVPGDQVVIYIGAQI